MKLVDKTREFLDEKCNMLATEFWDDVITNLKEWEELDKSIESPIEQLFYIEWLFRKFCDSGLELYFEPQYQDKTTGKYRIDFVVDFIQEAFLLEKGLDWDKVILQTEPPKLGIEIDSHIWHEKTKEQVQYHKKRERFLVSNGWKLLRFTGSEIYGNPTKCIQEVLDITNEISDKYHEKLRENFKKRNKIQ